MDNSIERYILLLVNLQLFTCYALVIQNKVILQERSFAETSGRLYLQLVMEHRVGLT